MKNQFANACFRARAHVLLASLFVLACQASATAQALMPQRIILNLTTTPATSQAVTWRTKAKVSKPQAQIVVANPSTNLEENAVTVDATSEAVKVDLGTTMYSHSVIFESLQPDTLYAYRVGSDSLWSEWNQFRTAANEAKPFTFLYFGDPQNEILSMCSRVFRAAYTKAPEADFWLLVGDIVNHGDSDSEWGEFYDALGWIPRSTSFLPLPGNHEYKKSESDGSRGVTSLWRPQFTLPENGPEGLEEQAYYLDYQGVRFVMLNGNEKLDEQSKWLKKVLRDNPQKWTIVSIHQPFYSTAAKRDNPYHRMLFVPVFEKYGVDLVLQGHDHTYGRTYKVLNGKKRELEDEKGVVYVVTVTGPKQYDPSNLYKDLMAKTGTQTQLFQVIRIDGGKLKYEAYTATGELFDSFELSK